ncbi:MAG: YihY/virulence factor BrkB family protein [Vicinamibacterales bacterium]
MTAARTPVVARWARRAIARARRAARLGWQAAGRGLIEFYHSSNLTYASSIAYYTLLSMFPFLLLVATLLSRLAVSGDTLLPVVERALPSNLDFLVTRIRDIASAPLQLSVAGFVVTLWASMGVFGAITSAVNHAWAVETPLGFFRHKLIAFLMMLASGLLLVAALAIMSAAPIVQAEWFAGVLHSFPALESLSGFVYQNAATFLFILVVGLIYYFVPNAKVRLRDVWFGAILAGLLWRGAFAGFAWYMRDLDRLRSVQGSITAVVVFLAWVYISAVILLYGVEVTAAFARLRRHVPGGQPPAEPVEAVAAGASASGGRSRPPGSTGAPRGSDR